MENDPCKMTEADFKDDYEALEGPTHNYYYNEDTKKVHVDARLDMGHEDGPMVKVGIAWINTLDDWADEDGELAYQSKHISLEQLIRTDLVECAGRPEPEDPVHYLGDCGDPDCANRYIWMTRSPYYPDIIIDDEALLNLLKLKEAVDEMVKRYIPEGVTLITEEEANRNREEE